MGRPIATSFVIVTNMPKMPAIFQRSDMQAEEKQNTMAIIATIGTIFDTKIALYTDQDKRLRSIVASPWNTKAGNATQLRN
mmetsp:Transcript_30356/g.54527  ORF Transcript_30356/g.54527 Transcript_30356/m.54527 type:complete len:81 (-) Transcript_30356:159-401(-)